MSKVSADSVVKYYVLCNRLKDIIRTGWKDWHVERDRVESIAEHIFGVQQLAIAMYQTYNYDIDLAKVIFMLAIHESEEVFIGDLTQFQISKDEKRKIGKDAVKKLFSNLINSEYLTLLIDEFEKRESKEAIFAFQCDKLECDIQCKLYDEEHCVDLNNQEDNISFFNKDVQRILKSSNSWSDAWLEFGRERYKYDKNFNEVSLFVQNNLIGLKDENKQ